MRGSGNKKMFAIVVLLLFFGSSIAVAFVQHFGVSTPNEIRLPERVKNSEYTAAEEGSIIGNGFVVFSYTFPETCEDCKTKKNFLVSFSDINSDVYLSLVGGSTEILSIKNSRGSVILTSQNITEEKVSSAYCSITNFASDECIVSQI